MTPEEHAAWLASLLVPQTPTTGVGAFFGKWPETTLSERLRRLLARHNCSIGEAARRANMEKQQLYRVVSGRNTNPGYRTVERIVTAVGGTMKELHDHDED